jgi:hypothetical protein
MRRRLPMMPPTTAVSPSQAVQSSMIVMQDALCAALGDANTPSIIAKLVGRSERHVRNILHEHFVLDRDYGKPGKSHIIPRATAERIIREHLCRIGPKPFPASGEYEVGTKGPDTEMG